MPKTSRQPQTAAEKRQRVRRAQRVRRFLVILVVIGLLVGLGYWYTWRPLMPPTPIFQGVTYSCEELPSTEDSSGRLHLVVVDFKVPGVEFYATGISGSAALQQYDYRLRMATGVAREDGLAVLVNGTYFSANSWFIPLPGDMARARDTIIVPNQASRVNADNYLFWLDAENTPRIETEAPPAPEVISKSKWGIGGMELAIRDGVAQPLTTAQPGARTLLGVNTENKLLYLAVFEHASYRAAAKLLAERGVKNAITLSGGFSSTMVIGDGAANIAPGAVVGGWRPLATFIGVKAPPLK